MVLNKEKSIVVLNKSDLETKIDESRLIGFNFIKINFDGAVNLKCYCHNSKKSNQMFTLI